MNKIEGYKELSDEQIDVINKIKKIANGLGDLIDSLNGVEAVDKRWLAIGKTELQQGFMAITRSIANPDSF